MNLNKKKGIVLMLIFVFAISLIASVAVYASTNTNYTVTINFDKNKYEASYRKDLENQDVKTGSVVLKELYKNQNGEVQYGIQYEIRLIDAETEWNPYIGNVSFNNEEGTVTFAVEKQNEEDTLPATKLEVNNNVLYLSEQNGIEVEMENADEYGYSRIMTNTIEQNTTYNLITHRRISLSYYYNEESINAKKDTVTYNWNYWDNENNNDVIAPVNVSIVKGTVSDNIINVESTEVLTKQDPENEQATVHELKLNSSNYEGYYIKVSSKVNDQIALNYRENNKNEYWNLYETTIRDNEGNYYIDLSSHTEDIEINYVGSRMDSHKVVFENYEAIDKNILTYKYNNKNVYAQLVQVEWGPEGQHTEIPVTLTKQDGVNKYEYSFVSQNNYSDYCIKLSYDDNDSLEGLVWIKINNIKAESTWEHDEEHNTNYIIYDKINLYNYSEEEITINGLYSLIGDISVNFADVSYRGNLIHPTIDEHQGLVYRLDNDNNTIQITLEEKWGEGEDDWRWIDIDSVDSFKIFSDEISSGKYRISIGGGNTYLKVNGTEAQMDEEEGREYYILQAEDIVDNTITLDVGFYYTFTVQPGQEERITISNNMKSATWHLGDGNTNDVTASFSKGQFVQEGIIREIDGEPVIEHYYELKIKDAELADNIIELTNFNNETMEVNIRNWEEENYKLPVIQNNEKNYVKLTELTTKIMENEQEIQVPYYLPTGFQFDIGMKGEHNNIEVPAPNLEAGYLAISMLSDPGATGSLVYYFVDSTGKYLEANGTVMSEQKEPAGEFTNQGDTHKKVQIPSNTVKVLIGVNTGANTDLFGTTLYKNDTVEPRDKDLVMHSRTLEIPYTEGDSIGFAVGYGFYSEGFVPTQKGTYFITEFSGDTESVVKYLDSESQEHSLAYNTFAEGENNVIPLPRQVTLQIPEGKMENLHIDLYDGQMNYLPEESGDISLLLADEENETKNFKAWMSKLRRGEMATLDLSTLNQDYTFVINLKLRDPNENSKAHVLTWTNVKGTGWPDDALIDGGFARLVKAYDSEDNLIFDVNEQYDDSHYIIDEHSGTKKFKHGALLPYTWERGPMYPFAVLQDANGGEVEAIGGIKLVFEFTPVYGKQLVEVSLGESVGVSESTEKYYQLTMPSGNHVHFNARFEKINNESLIGSNTSVSSVKYTLDDKALDSGTAVLSIDKVDDLSDTQKTEFASKAGNNYQVSTYLDVDLTQVWFKGTDAQFNTNTGYSADDVWTNEIYDLGNKKATVTLTLDKGISPDDIIILHENHDAEGNPSSYEVIPIKAKQKDENGVWTITFETSKFSNYAIGTHTHTPKTTTTKTVTKATLSKNGTIKTTTVTKCSTCGEELGGAGSQEPIYYPKTIKLKTTSYTYDGKVKTPAVVVTASNGKTITSSNYTVKYASGRKNVGEYKVTITFIGNYSGTKTLTFKINPKGTSLSKLTAAKKKFTAKWKKQATQTTGYQIQYSTNKKFASGNKTVKITKTKTVSKVISSLKAKKYYYVRIRTYKTVGGKTYYSSWSGSKSIKTK